MASLEFLGATNTVTGSKFLVETGAGRLLVDCGFYQGLKALRQRNWDRLPVDPASIDWVVLPHGHIDHTGYLPRLMHDGFRGCVSATRATADLLKILLPNCGHLQEDGAAYHNKRRTTKHRPASPLYTAEEGLAAAERVEGVAYNASLSLSPDLRITFRRAGHILGSAAVTVEVQGRRVVFSGDLGRYGAPILPDPMPIEEADVIVVESTYGDRRQDCEPVPDQLELVIHTAVDPQGAVIVPAFAIGRTQELNVSPGSRAAARAPECVCVAHGDPEPATALARRVRSELGWNAVVPEYRDRHESETMNARSPSSEAGGPAVTLMGLGLWQFRRELV